MKTVALSEMKDDLSRYLRLASKEELLITRHGKAAGVLIGFDSEDDWFEYRLEHDARFLDRIARARASLRVGRGVHFEDLADTTASAKTRAPRPKKRRSASPRRAPGWREPKRVR